jgi:hypothetical protein
MRTAVTLPGVPADSLDDFSVGLLELDRDEEPCWAVKDRIGALEEPAVWVYAEEERCVKPEGVLVNLMEVRVLRSVLDLKSMFV